jgi:hypothetical protein
VNSPAARTAKVAERNANKEIRPMFFLSEAMLFVDDERLLG